MKEEIWVNVIGYENVYNVSNTGKVKRLDFKRITPNGSGIQKERVLNPTIHKIQGYKSVMLSLNGIHKYKKIHRMVAESFLNNDLNKPCINHKDGDKLNNNVENLEWVTYSENQQHAVLTGLARSGEMCSYAKLDRVDVLNIRNAYKKGVVTMDQLANVYNVSRRCIGKIVNYETWKAIKQN